MTATYEVIQDTVLSGTSSIGIGANAEITIRDADTAALVTLFQDRLGAGGETNPFNADANGQFRVYTLPKRLQISIDFESTTRVWEDFRLGPKTPKLASGDADKILKVNADEDGYEVTHALFKDYIAGLIISNGSEPTQDIDISAGVCRDSTDVYNIKGAAKTKQIDAVWAAGTDAGGFPSGLTSGSPVDGETYHIFLLGDTTDDTANDYGFDTSLAAANLLADAMDFDVFRAIGSIVYGNLTTLEIDPFTATELHGGGVRFQVVPVLEFNHSTPALGQIDTALAGVPIGIKYEIHGAFLVLDAGTGRVLIGDSDISLPLPTGSLNHIVVTAGATSNNVRFDDLCDASAKIAYRVSVNTINSVIFILNGWTDFRKA